MREQGEDVGMLIRILNEKIWNMKTNFFKELIKYAERKGAYKGVIAYLKAERRKIRLGE